MAYHVNFKLPEGGIHIPSAALTPINADQSTFSYTSIQTGSGLMSFMSDLEKGIGHFAAGQGDSTNNPRAKDKKRRRELRELFTQNELDQIQNRLLEIEQEKSLLAAKIVKLNERLNTLNHKIEETSHKLQEVCKKLEDAESLSEENLKRIADTNPITDMRFKELSEGFEARNPEAHKALKEEIIAVDREYVTMVHGDRSHIVWQDENGEYYLRNPDTGERIDVDQNNPYLLGALEELKPDSKGNADKVASESNEADQAAFQKYNNGYIKYFQAIENDPQLRELRQRVANIMAEREELLGHEVLTQRTIQELRGQKIELQTELEKLSDQRDMTEHEIQEAQKRIEELNDEKIRLENDLRELHKRQERQAQNIQDFGDETDRELDGILEELLQRHVQLSEDHKHIHQNTHEIIQTQNCFINRHAQLKSLYNLSNVREAWANSITTADGEHVYRDNIDPNSDTYLKLYTYNPDAPEGEKRTYLSDQRQISELNHQAYVEGRLFRNETPHGLDKGNSFIRTFKAILKADDIVDVVDANHREVDKELHDVSEQIQDVRARQQKAELNLSADFRNSNAHTPNQPSERSIIAKPFAAAGQLCPLEPDHTEPNTPTGPLFGNISGLNGNN